MAAVLGALSLCLVLAGRVLAGKAGVSASSSTVAMVRFFIDTETAGLPPEGVPEFIKVDPASLPRALRRPYRAKREELLALKRIADGRKKPPLRRLGVEGSAHCDPPTEDPLAAGILTLAGYGEIYEDEESHLMEDTKCSECELRVEFTLQMVLAKPPSKRGKAELAPRYFLHHKDPLWNLIAAYRAGRSAFGTNFFGIGRPSCR